ncbi:tetratricopeptide repeat protein [bacterium AH-315-J04]|nr:tetratricopeptide repeat protein [bacterium AH-315-J04]
MKITQKNAYVIAGVMLLFAIIPSSWYVRLYYGLWPIQIDRTSTTVVENKSWEKLIHQGMLDFKEHQYQEAETNFKAALKLVNRSYPKIHPLRAKTLSLLGRVLLEQNKSSEAITALDETVDIEIAMLPEGDVGILKSLQTLMDALYQSGETARAASTAKRLIAIADAHDKSVSEFVADALVTLSKFHLENDNVQAAKKLYLRVLDNQRQLYGEVSVSVVLARFYITGIAVTNRDNLEVEKQIEACKSIIKSLSAPISPGDVELLGAFIEALPSIGLADEAIEVRQLLHSLHPNLFVRG